MPDQQWRILFSWFELVDLVDVFRQAMLVDLDSQTAAAASLALERPGLVTVADQAYFRRALPDQEYEQRLHAGYHDAYLLSFAFRHRLTVLSVASHLASMDRTAGDYPQTVERLSLLLGDEFVAETDWVRTVFEAGTFSLGSGNHHLPVFGFSALGGHLQMCAKGQCRAFDPHEMDPCTNPADGLFCSDHADHAWWQEGCKPSASLPKMFAFYADRNNLHKYDEETLQRMVARFWRKFRVYSRSMMRSPGSIDSALSAFGYQAVDGLRDDGLAGLRRRYYLQAKQWHPDRGGENERFIELKNKYELLKGLLVSGLFDSSSE